MKNFTFLLILLLFSVQLRAQVGINTDDPNPKAMLDIIAQDKGILIPRLTETERDALTKAPDETLLLTMAENSLMIYNTTEDCFNYWHQADLEWKSLCGSLGKSLFTVDCPSVEAEGEYIIEKGLDGNNYLVLKVNVTKPGTWSVVAKSDPSNGYSFTGQGVFTEKGMQTIRIIGQGTPAVVQKDSFIISTTGSEDTCPFQVDVQPNSSTYSLQCTSATVNGVYKKGTSLTTSNTITMNINVSSLGSYSIVSESMNGIRFSASGIFTATGTQSITLQGTGIPNTNIDFSVKIKANTVNGNAECLVVIPVILPRLTYGVIGSGSYAWNTSERLNALNSSATFGPNGVVKIEGLSQLWNAASVGIAVNNLSPNRAMPDIILYNAYGIGTSNELVQGLVNYVNNGGVLIYGSKDGDITEANNLMLGIFGMTGTAQRQIAGSPTTDNTYVIGIEPSNQIINGPFGNLANKHWGEDNASTGSVVMNLLPPNSLQIATANNLYSKDAVDPAYSMVWYNESKNFVYFGDSVASSNSSTSTGGYPALFSSNGLPNSKLYGPTAGRVYVYNSALELNAVAWAIKKAAISGINPH